VLILMFFRTIFSSQTNKTKKMVTLNEPDVIFKQFSKATVIYWPALSGTPQIIKMGWIINWTMSVITSGLLMAFVDLQTSKILWPFDGIFKP
jgi:hypothetical protein